MYPGLPGETESRKRASGSFPPGTFDPAYASNYDYGMQQQPHQNQPQPQQWYTTDWNAQAGYSQPGYGMASPGPGMNQGMYQPQPSAWNMPNASAFPGGVADLLQNPMVTGAAAQLVDTHIGKYKDKLSTLKYYFAVDTACVVRKLGLLLFPFAHDSWEIQYREGEPVQPRHDANAPDLYIPLMAFVTYICVAGYVLGTKDKFDPEQLGIHASSALVWLVAEVLLLLLMIYLTQMPTVLKSYDLAAYCGYKYVGMIIATLVGTFVGSGAYYIALVYTGGALAFMMIRALRVQINPVVDEGGARIGDRGSKRRLYFLCSVSFVQPLLMWWRTSHLM